MRLEIYDEFRYLVQLYFLELKSVREYAEKIHVTPKHLSETVKKISGESALEIIHKTQILLKAEGLKSSLIKFKFSLIQKPKSISLIFSCC